LIGGYFYVEVSFGYFYAHCIVAIYAHGAKMNEVDVEAGINDSTKDVVGSIDVVVDSVTLVDGGLHAVGRGALLGEVDDGVRALVHKQLH